jgi:hypothetical protein
MMVRLRRLFRNPVFLIGLTAFLTAFLVQSGELGTSDTAYRLQTTHSFWTSDPPVDPQAYPDFGIHGREGKLFSWYGIGQSLLMLPPDIIGTYFERLPIFQDYTDDPTVRDIIVSYITNILVCVLTALVCFRLLGLLKFTADQRIAGTFALLYCTTFLHYTQNMTENNYILLLTLTGLTFQYEWFRKGRPYALLIGCGALGLNLLTRLTTGKDLFAASFFLLLVSLFTGVQGRALRSRFVGYAKVAFPVYALFALLDRFYQHYRFGSYFNTYIQVLAREQKLLNPALPRAYPFETPFHVGFWGALLKPEKSIFLFDPLLLLTLLLAALTWKRFQPEIRAYLVAFTALVFAYISFYAKFTDWSGDFAWGDRYVSTSVQLVAFISVPLIMRHRVDVSKVVRQIAIAIIAVSLLVQLSSIMFWCPLELLQMQTLGHPTFVIALRLKNIVAFSLGKMDQWGLSNEAMKRDPWDYAHISTFNFLPFLLARVGKAAGWIIKLLKIVWFAVFAATFLLWTFLWRAVRLSPN